jgi:hypothetical protein
MSWALGDIGIHMTLTELREAVRARPAGGAGSRVIFGRGAADARGASPAAPPGRHGWDRIVAGAEFLGRLDPGWWREGAMLPANLAALDMASPYRCVLAWWAAQYLPAPPQRGPRQIPPYDRVLRVLRLSPRDAEALGFTGVDADLLTSGWRHLITCLRACRGPGAAQDRASGRPSTRVSQ